MQEWDNKKAPYSTRFARVIRGRPKLVGAYCPVRRHAWLDLHLESILTATIWLFWIISIEMPKDLTHNSFLIEVKLDVG